VTALARAVAWWAGFLAMMALGAFWLFSEDARVPWA
jgi:hypothetical protein